MAPKRNGDPGGQHGVRIGLVTLAGVAVLALAGCINNDDGGGDSTPGVGNPVNPGGNPTVMNTNILPPGGVPGGGDIGGGPVGESPSVANTGGDVVTPSVDSTPTVAVDGGTPGGGGSGNGGCNAGFTPNPDTNTCIPNSSL